MSIKLEEFLRTLDSLCMPPQSAALLRQIATDLCTLQGRYEIEVGGIQSDCKTIVEDWRQCRSQSENQANGLDQVNREVLKINTRLSGFQKLEALEGRLSAVQNYISTLPLSLPNKLSDLQAQINANDQQTTALVSRVGNVEQELARVERRVDAQVKSNTELWKHFESLCLRVNNLDRRDDEQMGVNGAMSRRLDVLEHRQVEHAKWHGSREASLGIPQKADTASYGFAPAWARPIVDHEEVNVVSYGEPVSHASTTMGHTLPQPLPQWDSCTLVRGANAVFVSGGRQGPLEADATEVYSFDDFEIAGRFVAAVLTQPPPKAQVPLNKDRP